MTEVIKWLKAECANGIRTEDERPSKLSSTQSNSTAHTKPKDIVDMFYVFPNKNN